MNIFGVIHRYLSIKAMSPEERKKVVPRASIFGGKAAPGYWMVIILAHDRYAPFALLIFCRRKL
jgi:starch phosphorylase